jgi:hypothetical protein
VPCKVWREREREGERRREGTLVLCKLRREGERGREGTLVLCKLRREPQPG